MIQLHRKRTKAAIHEAFRDEKRIEQALTLLVQPGEEREFKSAYWKKAKNQLKKESGGKCAYCESPTAVVAHGDVEHFRPKSVYWWLAYCYDNYLFSCQICNQAFKGDSFPLASGAVRMAEPVLPPGATAEEKRELVRRFAPDPLDDAEGQPSTQFLAACKAENGLLLDPYTDDPEQHFIWEADATLWEVAVRPKQSASESLHHAAVEFYGLNRPELLAERWKTFSLLDTLCEVLDSPALPAAL